MDRSVTIAIPAMPERRDTLLPRALRSVWAQMEPVDAVSVAVDIHGEGGSATRNRAIAAVRTEWTVLLDDDDELLPRFTTFLLDCAEADGLDMAWGWYEVIGGGDPFPASFRGRQFDLADPHVVPITILVRTALLHATIAAIGGFQPNDPGWSADWGVMDRPVWEYIIGGGAKARAFPDTVWHWHHHGANSSGVRPSERSSPSLAG